jgi:hypothetical protein
MGFRKALLRGKFTILVMSLKNTERFQIHELILNFKYLEIQEQANPQNSKRREKNKNKSKN